MILSPHFMLAEFEVSDTADRKGIVNRTMRFEQANLRLLCVNVLEPLRERFGPLRITSGFRNANLNRAVGGVPTSAHRYGCAADLVAVDPKASVGDLWHWLAEHKGLPYDQVIWERRRSGSEWLHVGIRLPDLAAPRGMAFKVWK